MVRVLSAKMEVLYDFENKSSDQVLLSYTAYKGWRTRNVEKVMQMIPLQNNAYSMTTEKEMQHCLASVEKLGRKDQGNETMLSVWVPNEYWCLFQRRL